jgi:hypothetical protein
MHSGLSKPQALAGHRALPLGQLLVASGLLTQQALDDVLATQKTDGRGLRLGELLEAKGLVQPHQLAQFLSHQLSCPWVSLQRIEVTREAVDVLPRAIALKHHMVPVHLRTSKGKAALYVAMDDPTDDVALSEASAATTMPVKPMVALSSEIRTHLERLYGADAVALAASIASTASTASTASQEAVRPRSPSIATIPPTITVKDDAHARSTPSRPPKPPPPKASVRPPPREEMVLDDVELVDELPPTSAAPEEPQAVTQPRPILFAKLVVVGVSDKVLATLRRAARELGAEAVATSLPAAAEVAARHSPCAIVVTEELYANERLGLDRIALDVGAQLVVSSDDFHDHQLEALCEGAIRRWRRASYAKGTILEGRYELLRDLGGRLTGSRWEVRHLRTARRSKLKIGVGSAHDGTDADAIRREQMALARVHHPGAVDLRDAGNTELGDPYVIVEMLEGRTLEGLGAARGGLPPEQASTLVHRIAEVLAAVHDAGVRHGAVRPDNVLIVRSPWGVERAKLIQWESATVMDDREGGFDCTHNVAHDLAGLGACAFFAFTGRTRNEAEVVTSAGLPPKIASVIARALVGRDRFASVKDFIKAFESATPSGTASLQLLAADPERRGVVFGGDAPVSTRRDSPRLDYAHAPLPAELRRFGRAAYRTPVRIEIAGGGAIEGRSEDISESGLLVVTRDKIADGADITLRFALPIDGNVVSETGVVRWSRAPRSGDNSEPRAIGIEFSAVTEESARQIGHYVSLMSS